MNTDTMKEQASDAMHKVKNSAEDIIDNVKSHVQDVMDDPMQEMKNTGEKIKHYVKNNPMQSVLFGILGYIILKKLMKD